MKRTNIYPCLMAQMYLKGYDSARLAREIGIPYVALRRRLRGEIPLLLQDACRIRDTLQCSLPLDVLFERKENLHDA